jgi:hypothetical protein
MAMGSYSADAHSRAPIAVVWDVLADTPGWKRWAGITAREASWAREGDDPPGGVGAVRRLGSPPFCSNEEILEWMAPRHMAYTIIKGFPVRGYHADVDLAEDTTGTRIQWRGYFEAKLPGTAGLLSWFLHRLIGGYARRAADEADRRHLRTPRGNG